MCVSPIYIRNPNRGLSFSNTGLDQLKDTTSAFIPIPCGHCHECVRSRQMSFVQRVQMESLNNHLFFATLTYKNSALPSIGTSILGDDGEPVSIPFADKRDFSMMAKRIRNNNLFGRPFRFVFVTELGSKRSRPHFHVLFFLPKQPADDYVTCLQLEQTLFQVVLSEWRRNYGSRRCPDYRSNCDFVVKWIHGKRFSSYDLHFVNPNLSSGSQGDVAFYVSKYMVKESDNVKRLSAFLNLNLPDEEYRSVWKIVRPSWSASPLFGLNGEFVSHNVYKPDPDVLSYLRDCVRRSREISDLPVFFNPLDGKTFPLSRYFLSRLDVVSVDDWLFFADKAHRDGSKRSDNVQINERSISQILAQIDVVKRKFAQLDLDFDDFENVFEDV